MLWKLGGVSIILIVSLNRIILGKRNRHHGNKDAININRTIPIHRIANFCNRGRSEATPWKQKNVPKAKPRQRRPLL